MNNLERIAKIALKTNELVVLVIEERDNLRRAQEKAIEIITNHFDSCPYDVGCHNFEDEPTCDSCAEPSEQVVKDCWETYFMEQNDG